MCFLHYFVSETSLFIHLFLLLLLGKSFAEDLSTNNCAILHPALGQNPELSDSSKYPHFSALKIKPETFDAPGLKESPSQI